MILEREQLASPMRLPKRLVDRARAAAFRATGRVVSWKRRRTGIVTAAEVAAAAIERGLADIERELDAPEEDV